MELGSPAPTIISTSVWAEISILEVFHLEMSVMSLWDNKEPRPLFGAPARAFPRELESWILRAGLLDIHNVNAGHYRGRNSG